nr:MAG TPA: hypothetical protein [Caudoviricetes sp.]
MQWQFTFFLYFANKVPPYGDIFFDYTVIVYIFIIYFITKL